MEKYTYDYCKKICKLFKTKTDLKKEYYGVYDKIARAGWLKELCSHMYRPPKPRKWTKEKCIELIKQYEFLKDFRENEPHAYAAICQNNWQEILCVLKKMTDGGKKCIYAYEFKEYNFVYIGLTYNLYLRNIDHHRKGSVYNFVLKNGITEFSPILLKDNINGNDAGYYENLYMEKYKQNGWNLINKAKAGSLGGMVLKNDDIVVFNNDGKMVFKGSVSKAHNSLNIPLILIRRCLLHKSKTTTIYKIFSMKEWTDNGKPSIIEPFKPKTEEIAIMDDNFNFIQTCISKKEAKTFFGITSTNCSVINLRHNTINNVKGNYKICFLSDYKKIESGEYKIIEIPNYHFKKTLIIPSNLSEQEENEFILKILKEPQWIINKKERQKKNRNNI